MVQLQILSKVLATKDISIITNNNLTSDYFIEFSEEYDFISNHYSTYGVVPDEITFVSKFPDVELLQVNESERYLVDAIREEHLYSQAVPIIKKMATLVKGDANAAVQYLQSEIQNLVPTYSTPYIDIIHSDYPNEMFLDKSVNKDKWFITTGFEELDDIICGLQRGEEYVVLFARTGQGKSWILVNILKHSWELGFNVGYISPEMSGVKLAYRFDTLNAHFSNMALTRGDTSEINPEEYKKYREELKKHENKFLVATPQDFSNEVTVGKLRAFIKENNLDVLGIDGISYMKDERYKRGDNLSTTLKNISEDLMSLSCELKIPVIVVVQSNRGGADKDTPDIEDIRDSDGISFNATKIISLKQKDETLVMQIKKNRDGRAGGKLTYNWNIDKGEFEYNPEDNGEYIQQEVPQRERKVTESKEKKRVAF